MWGFKTRGFLINVFTLHGVLQLIMRDLEVNSTLGSGFMNRFPPRTPFLVPGCAKSALERRVLVVDGDGEWAIHQGSTVY